MIAHVVRSVVLLLMIVLSYFVIMWIIVYLHTYINGLFIPNELRWQNGKLKEDQSQWLTVGMLIGVVEWAGLIWLSYRLSRWYSLEWPLTTQKWVTKLSTIVVAGATGATLLLFYARTITEFF
jgi:hypothetical protein